MVSKIVLWVTPFWQGCVGYNPYTMGHETICDQAPEQRLDPKIYPWVPPPLGDVIWEGGVDPVGESSASM